MKGATSAPGQVAGKPRRIEGDEVKLLGESFIADGAAQTQVVARAATVIEEGVGGCRPQIGHRRRADGLAQGGGGINKQVVNAGFVKPRFHSQPDGAVTLGIQVDEQHALAKHGKRRSKIDRYRRLAGVSLALGDGKYAWGSEEFDGRSGISRSRPPGHGVAGGVLAVHDVALLEHLDAPVK